MREIPKKNYLYLVILIIITILLTLVFFNVYNNYSYKKESFISKNLNCINSLDLNSLLTENSILFVYIDSIYNSNDNKQQEKLLDDLKALDVNKNFVFYDNNTKENQKYMKDNYKYNIKDKKLLLVFEDNKLVISKEIGSNLVDDILDIVYKVDDIND